MEEARPCGQLTPALSLQNGSPFLLFVRQLLPPRLAARRVGRLTLPLPQRGD